MRRTIAGMALLLVTLSGCASTTSPDPGDESAPATSATPSPAASPTPTIPPGPVQMDDAQAGAFYLGLVCQPNQLKGQLNALLDEQFVEWQNGATPDLAAVDALLAEGIRLNRQTLELLDDGYFTWPEDVAPRIDAFRSLIVLELSDFDSQMQLNDPGAVYNFVYTEAPLEQSTAPQEIRYLLEIAGDTATSCVGHETALDALHAAMVDRNEYLATFV